MFDINRREDFYEKRNKTILQNLINISCISVYNGNITLAGNGRRIY